MHASWNASGSGARRWPHGRTESSGVYPDRSQTVIASATSIGHVANPRIGGSPGSGETTRWPAPVLLLPMVHCNHKRAEIRTAATPFRTLKHLFYSSFSSGIALALLVSG